MVGVAQLVERQIVVLNVGGSSPLTHPFFLSPHMQLKVTIKMLLS